MAEWLHIGFDNVAKNLLNSFFKEQTFPNYILDFRKNDYSQQNYIFKIDGEDYQQNCHTLISLDVAQRLANIRVVSISIGYKDFEKLTSLLQQIIDNSNSSIAIVIFKKNQEINKQLKEVLKGKYFLFNGVADRISFIGKEKKVITEEKGKLLLPYDLLSFLPITSNYIFDNVEIMNDINLFLVHGLHATIAYFGCEKDLTYIWEVMHNYFEEVNQIKMIYQLYLEKEFPNSDINFKEEVNKVINRFSRLKEDTIKRVGKHPEIKCKRFGRLEPIFQNNTYITTAVQSGIKKYKEKYN